MSFPPSKIELAVEARNVFIFQSQKMEINLWYTTKRNNKSEKDIV